MRDSETNHPTAERPPSISYQPIIWHRGHPSRLPSGGLRPVLLGPVRDAEDRIGEEEMEGSVNSCNHNLSVCRAFLGHHHVSN